MEREIAGTGESWCPSPTPARCADRCSRLNATTPASRSTSHQRSPQSSPRRIHANLDVPDQRSDVLAAYPTYVREPAALQGGQLKMPVEHLVDRGRGARMAPLVDLAGKPSARPSPPPPSPCPRASRHDLAEVVPPLVTGYDSGVDGSQRSEPLGSSSILPRARLRRRAPAPAMGVRRGYSHHIWHHAEQGRSARCVFRLL